MPLPVWKRHKSSPVFTSKASKSPDGYPVKMLLGDNALAAVFVLLLVCLCLRGLIVGHCVVLPRRGLSLAMNEPSGIVLRLM
jgi:hypothetical protein